MHGVIDEHTLVWGQGLGDWLPVRNVRTLVPQIRTFEGVPQICLGLLLCLVTMRSAAMTSAVYSDLVLCLSVRVATWIKKTFALKPALAQIRKTRAEQRAGNEPSLQVDGMY